MLYTTVSQSTVKCLLSQPIYVNTIRTKL